MNGLRWCGRVCVLGCGLVAATSVAAIAANDFRVSLVGVPVAAGVEDGTAMDGRGHMVPLFPAAANARGWQGFLRITNHSEEAGTVSILAVDDAGTESGPLSLTIDAGETIHLNSDDVEFGNASKGLAGGTGAPGSGDWRLDVASELRLEVLSYVRTADGFVTPMHDVAPLDPAAAQKRRIVAFNPGSNQRQESLLRLVNTGASEATVTIFASDDRGAAGGRVRATVAPGAARVISAAELEQGGAFDGSLGDGIGKWRLEVWTDAPVVVMSLLATPTGHVTNWSTTPGVAGGPKLSAPPEVSIASATEVAVTWVGAFEGLFATYDVEGRYRGDDGWALFSGCVEFTGDGPSNIFRLTATVSLDDELVGGSVVQARYRYRGDSFCLGADPATTMWSHVGEALVAGEYDDSGGEPDLVVESASVDDASPDTGDSFDLSVAVRNRGDGDAAATTLRYYRSSNMTISSSDTEVGTDSVGSLAGSEVSDESVTLTAPSSAGTYYYGACVDAVANESATSNNCSEGVRVEVSDGGGGSSPDLIVESAAVDDNMPDPGASFTFSATVRNRGDGSSGSTTLRYYRSSNATISTGDTEVGTDSVGGLAASDTSNESIRLTAPSTAGTYYFGACVDSVAGESSTTNNCSRGVAVEVSDGGGGGGEDYVAFDGLTIGDDGSVTLRAGGIQLGAGTTNCIRGIGTYNGRRYGGHWSAWQRNSGSGWTEVSGSRQDGGICGYDLSTAGSGTYRLVGDMTLADVRDLYKSANEVTK